MVCWNHAAPKHALEPAVFQQQARWLCILFGCQFTFVILVYSVYYHSCSINFSISFCDFLMISISFLVCFVHLSLEGRLFVVEEWFGLLGLVVSMKFCILNTDDEELVVLVHEVLHFHILGSRYYNQTNRFQ